MTGHCRHCGLDMLLVSEGDTQEQYACDDWQHRNNNGAEWDDGCCPACAEAKRLRAALQAAHRTCNQAEAAGLLSAVEIVARTARGES